MVLVADMMMIACCVVVGSACGCVMSDDCKGGIWRVRFGGGWVCGWYCLMFGVGV